MPIGTLKGLWLLSSVAFGFDIGILLGVLLTGHVIEATTAFCASVGYVLGIVVGMHLELRYRNGDA
jgi:choline-glycine betaine transporter